MFAHFRAAYLALHKCVRTEDEVCGNFFLDCHRKDNEHVQSVTQG